MQQQQRQCKEQRHAPRGKRQGTHASVRKVADGRRCPALRRAVAIDKRDPLQQAVGGQRDHNGRQAQHHHAHTIEHADQQARTQHQRYGPRCGFVDAMREPGQQHARQRDEPGHGKVESACQDHGALPKPQHRQEQGQRQQARIEVGACEDTWAIDHARDRDHREEQQIRRHDVLDPFAIAFDPVAQHVARELRVFYRTEVLHFELHAPRARVIACPCSAAPRGEPSAGIAHAMMRRRLLADRRPEHRQDQDHGFGDGRKERGYVEHQQDIDRDHQGHCGEHRAHATTSPATQPRAAQHDGREHGEQQRPAHQRIGGARLCRHIQARCRVEHAGERIGRDPIASHGHAVRIGAIGVAAERIQAYAEARTFDEGPHEQRDDEHGR